MGSDCGHCILPRHDRSNSSDGGDGGHRGPGGPEWIRRVASASERSIWSEWAYVRGL
ncbi:MAG: hypothetical protein LBJ95_02270 [Oscillospiraceae bacterium]|nr:hypothetical protein [Oscillospiraceae bacterium]